MEPFSKITSVAIPLIQLNVDTDAIIPSREMNKVSKRGLSVGLFSGWRYKDVGSREINPEFVFNDPKYDGAQIVLSGDNFGCGSSREHAVWALHEYGIRVIIAPSFGAIFYKNCIKNGVLPIELPSSAIKKMIDQVLSIDLEELSITFEQLTVTFDMAAADRRMLLEGLDDIDLNMLHKDQIKSFEIRDRRMRPWAYL